jgi:DNA invertase Pin-like site-specific DNA recombinase
MRFINTYTPTRVGNDEIQTSANASIPEDGASEPQSIVGSSETRGGGPAETCPADWSSDGSRGNRDAYCREGERQSEALTGVALYTRYSSDLQSAESNEDQSRVCRKYVSSRQNWKIIGSYADAAISGASLILRPEIQRLLKDAEQHKFEVVVAESLDRLSRNQADIATLFERLRFHGVQLFTVEEGEINELHVGLKGTMNALFLKNLAFKVRRGMQGRVLKGKAVSGPSYGYEILKHLDADGEPIRGDRKINPVQAEIVRRVLRQYAAGITPREIARRLNEQGIPGPSGGLWKEESIRGDVKHGTGLINNQLYIGKLVWNRHTHAKNPLTGKDVDRFIPPEQWITKEVPDLRIIDDELWEKVKIRQAEISEKYSKQIAAFRASTLARALNATHRPRSLLSGLLLCGCCDESYILKRDRYCCSRRVRSKSCQNNRTIRREELEHRVLDALRERFVDPSLAAEAMQAYVDAIDRHNCERRSSQDTDRKILTETQQKIKNMVSAIENGEYSPRLSARLQELEEQEVKLKERLQKLPEEIQIPSVGELCSKVERLLQAWEDPEERGEAVAVIRGLIDRIVITPHPNGRRGWANVTLYSDLAKILEPMLHNGESSHDGIPLSVVQGRRYHRQGHCLAIAA